MSQPKHIAIIMDGNRRWAKERGLGVLDGHNYVVNQVIEPLVDRCIEKNIPFLTLWAFSTENWRRNPAEIQGIMNIFREAFQKKAADLHKKGVKLQVIGDLSKFPADIQKKSAEWIALSQRNKKITVTFALNYGGHDELIRAVRAIIRKNPHIQPEAVTEQQITRHLDTAAMPDPDIIIRTSGEKRLSGFLPWQSVYSELYFTDIPMPDFTPRELQLALEEYNRRKRRFGK